MASRPFTPIDRNPDDLESVLPWYLNDTLDPADRDWVETQLAGRDDLMAFDRALQHSLQARAEEVPADIGWSKLVARVRADEAPARSAPASEESFGARVGRLFAEWMTPRMGMAMAVLLAVQTVGIGYLVNEQAGHEGVTYRSAAQVAPVPVIRAMFPEDLTERRLREALGDAGLTIVDGPTPLGEYFLAGPAERLEVVARTLQDQGVLQHWSVDYKPMIR